MDGGPPSLRDQFLQGMSCAAATVNVVTTDGPAGRAGVTVSAMTSVSADGPAPTMLVCVHHMSPSAAIIIENGAFCANVLRDDQSFVSDIFAGRLKTADGDKFSCADWAAMSTGAPRIRDPLAAFDCTVISAERVGTHHVFIGEVREIFVAASGSPLIFANRAYGSPVNFTPARTEGAALDTLRVGALHTFGPYLLPSVLQELEEAHGRVRMDLHEGDQRRLRELLQAGDIDVAFLYDFDLGDEFLSSPIADLHPYVLLPEGHRLTEMTEIPLAELLSEPMVLLDAPPSRDYFLSLFDGVGTPDIAFSAQSFEMVRGMVGHGLGYSILATKPASAMSYDGKALAMRPLAGPIATSRLVLTRRRDRPMSKITETFLWHCTNVFGLDLD